MTCLRLLIALLISAPRYQKLSLRAAFLLFAAIVLFGSIPGARANVGAFASGIVLHLSAYSILTLLLYCGVGGSAWGRACKACLTIAAMGAVDECVQGLFPYRHADPMDWLVDVNAGVFISALLWAAWPKGEASARSESAA